MLVFLGKIGRKTAQVVKNYGGSKMLRIRAGPRTIFSTEGLFGTAAGGGGGCAELHRKMVQP